MNYFEDHYVDDIGDVQMKMLIIILLVIRIENSILEETDVTPEPVGGQGIDKGVEEGEDNVWVMIVTLVFVVGYWLLLDFDSW